MWHQIHNQRAIVENREIANRFSVGQGTVVDFDSSGKIVQNITKNNPSWVKATDISDTRSGNQVTCCQLTDNFIGYIYQPDSTNGYTYAAIWDISQGKVVGQASDNSLSKVYSNKCWGCHKLSDNIFVGICGQDVFWCTFNNSTGEINNFERKGAIYYGPWSHRGCCWISDTVLFSCKVDINTENSTTKLYIQKSEFNVSTKEINSTFLTKNGSSNYEHISGRHLSFMERFKKIDEKTLMLMLVGIPTNANTVGMECYPFLIDLDSLTITKGNHYTGLAKLNTELWKFDSWWDVEMTNSEILVYGYGYGVKTSTGCFGGVVIPYSKLLVTTGQQISVLGNSLYRFYSDSMFDEQKNYIAGICLYNNGSRKKLTLIKALPTFELLDSTEINGDVSEETIDLGIIPVKSPLIQYFSAGNKGYVMTAQIQGKRIAGTFSNSSTTAIALEDGDSGSVIPVILEGTLYQDWVTTSTQIRSAGINGQGIVDKWLNVIPKWQYQLLKA